MLNADAMLCFWMLSRAFTSICAGLRLRLEYRQCRNPPHCSNINTLLPGVSRSAVSNSSSSSSSIHSSSNSKGSSSSISSVVVLVVLGL